MQKKIRKARNPKGAVNQEFNEVFRTPDEGLVDVHKLFQEGHLDWDGELPEMVVAHHWANETFAVTIFNMILEDHDLANEEESDPRESVKYFENLVSRKEGRAKLDVHSAYSIAYEEADTFCTLQICHSTLGRSHDTKVTVDYIHLVPKKTLDLGEQDISLEITIPRCSDHVAEDTPSIKVAAFGESDWIDECFIGGKHDFYEGAREQVAEAYENDFDEDMVESQADYDMVCSALWHSTDGGRPLNLAKYGFDGLRLAIQSLKKLRPAVNSDYAAKSLAFSIFACNLNNPNGIDKLKNFLNLILRHKDLSYVTMSLGRVGALPRSLLSIVPLLSYVRGEGMPHKLGLTLNTTDFDMAVSPLWVPLLQEVIKLGEDREIGRKFFQTNFSFIEAPTPRELILSGDAYHTMEAVIRLNTPFRYLREKFRGAKVARTREETRNMPIKFFANGNEEGAIFIFLGADKVDQCSTWLHFAEEAYKEFYKLATTDEFEKTDELDDITLPDGWERITKMSELVDLSQKYGWCAGSREDYRQKFKKGYEFFLLDKGADFGDDYSPILAMYDDDDWECHEAKTRNNGMDYTNSLPNLLTWQDEEEEE